MYILYSGHGLSQPDFKNPFSPLLCSVALNLAIFDFIRFIRSFYSSHISLAPSIAHDEIIYQHKFCEFEHRKYIPCMHMFLFPSTVQTQHRDAEDVRKKESVSEKSCGFSLTRFSILAWFSLCICNCRSHSTEFNIYVSTGSDFIFGTFFGIASTFSHHHTKSTRFHSSSLFSRNFKYSMGL